MKHKRFIWFSDFSDTERSGGAQFTNRTIINKGREMGIDIEEIYLSQFDEGKYEEKNLGSEGDVFIINNFIKWYMTYPDMIEKIVDDFNFIRFVHDYDFIYGNIPEKLIKKIFDKAIVSFFLSPLHLNETKKVGISIKKEYIIPSPIEIDKYAKFSKESGKRIKNSIIYIGEVASHKGINNIINYALLNPEKTLDIYGWIPEPYLLDNLPKNVKYKGNLLQEKVAETLSRYEYSIHLPIWSEPFGRSVAEAFFSGCKLITNNRVGFMSYIKEFIDVAIVGRMIKESAEVFWLKVLKETETL